MMSSELDIGKIDVELPTKEEKTPPATPLKEEIDPVAEMIVEKQEEAPIDKTELRFSAIENAIYKLGSVVEGLMRQPQTPQFPVQQPPQQPPVFDPNNPQQPQQSVGDLGTLAQLAGLLGGKDEGEMDIFKQIGLRVVDRISAGIVKRGMSDFVNDNK